MSDNVIPFDGVTVGDVPVEQVLKGAEEANLDMVVVLGFEPDGEEWFASSTGDLSEVLWLLERFKAFLMSRTYDEEDE